MTHFRNLPAVVLSGRCFPRAAILAVLLVAAVLVPGGNAHAQTVSNFTCNQNGIDSVQICWYISGTNCSWPLTWPGATIYVDNVPISSTGSSSGCITYSGLVPGFHSFKIRAEKCYSNSNPAYGYCSQLVSCSPPNVSCSLPSIDTAQINIFNQQAYPSVDIIMTPPSGGPVVVYSGPPITVYWVTLQEPGVHEFSVVAGVLSGPPCPSVSCTVQAVFPEVCNNGIDDDLDSLIDCADPDCAADPACGCWPETQQMTPGLGSLYVFAGMSVSVSGDVMVVGIADDDGMTEGGAAYIYLLDPQTGQWIQFQQLQDPNGTPVDHFGYSVSVSGDVIVIGEPGDGLLDTGRAFVYERDPQSGLWLEVDQLTASSPFSGNTFGASVSVSGDVLVVGAFDYFNGSNQGSVYLFERDINGAWLQTQELSDLGGGGLGSGYGSSVSIMDDVIVVGQPYDDVQGNSSGSVLVYELDNMGFWQETQKLLKPGGTTGDRFGKSVDICDDVIAIGVPGDADQGPDSGSAFVFERDYAGIWQPTPLPLPSGGAPVDHFGSAVSISANTIVIGSQWDDDQGPNSGSAFVYQRDTLTGPWLETEKLLASDGAQDFWFGSAVSISGETIAVAGGYYFLNGGGPSWPIGRAYIYTLDPTCQLPSLEVCDNGIDDDCDGWIDCEDPDCAGFSVWQPPEQLLDPNGTALDGFGNSVAVSGDTIVVGSVFDADQGYDSGSAFVFERVGGVWQPPVQLLDPNGAPLDMFGWSVAVSGDTIVVGALNAQGAMVDSGSAFVFERVGGVWQPPEQLLDPNGAAGDWFGYSVAVSGDTIVVGSRNDADQGFQSGSAFVFERVGGVWQPPVQLLDPNGAAEDWFGFSVAVSGDTIVVGSLHDDDQGTNSGSAFVFEQPLCPTAGEICGNGIDDDNDGLIDCDDTNCIGEINCIGNGFVFIAPVIDVNYPENTGEASFNVRLSIREDPTSAGFPSETQAFSMALIYDRDLIEATSIELSDILLETLGVPPVFFQVDASAGSLTASVVFDGTIQFDDEIAVLNVGFQTNPEVIAGSSGSSVRSLVWADSAALANLVIVSGEPIAPQFIDGAVALHPVSGQPPISTGDPNGDGSIDISDTITLLSYLFSAAAINCVAAGDVNGDNQVDVADPIFLLTFIFAGGPPPVGGTECTPDPTPADPPLECESSGCP